MHSKSKWLVVVTLILFFSCKKETFQESLENVQNVVKPVRYPETQEEIALVERINNLSTVIRKVLRNQDANQEIAAVIKGGYYTDERIKIGDLLNFNQSPAYKTKAYLEIKEKFGIREGSFKEEFTKNMPQITLMNDSWYFDDLVLYFPYSENFDMPRHYTLVPGVVEADAWEGWIILDDSETTGIVNDDYAYSKPVLIITSGAEPDIIMDCTTNPNWCNDPLPDPPGLNLRRVEVGWIRTKDNYDRLIGFNNLNSGGNEVIITRTSGYLHFSERGKIKDFAGPWIRTDFKRLDGRNKTWRPIYQTIDPNWREDNLQQVFSSFELDGRGEIKWNGKIFTKIKIKILGQEVEINGEVQFEHIAVSEDQLFFTQPYEWHEYVGEVRNPIRPNELKPIRNNAFFNYLPPNSFNFSNGSARDNRYLPSGEFWNIVPLGGLSDITWPYQIIR